MIGLMMARIGRNWSPLFTLIKYKIAVFHEVYILLHFHKTLEYNGMTSTKISTTDYGTKDLSVLSYQYSM